jgi:hypothetical protein
VRHAAQSRASGGIILTERRDRIILTAVDFVLTADGGAWR